MRKLLTILLIFVCYVAVAQEPYIFSGVDSTLDSYQGYAIYPRTSEQVVNISLSRFIQPTSSGYILQCGDDGYIAETVHNLDGAIIKGNYLEFTGTPATGSLHGMIAGYNINYDISRNYIKNSFFGIVHEGGYDGTGLPMENTSGGIYGNIFNNTRSGIYIWGYDSSRFFGNLIYNSLSASASSNPIRVGLSNGTTPNAYSKNARIINNIIYSINDLTAVWVYAGCDTGLVVDYNVYYCETCTDNAPSFRVVDTIYDWDEWRALGYDAHSVILDPNFIDTISFVPDHPLYYGTSLEDDYQYGLSPDTDWSSWVVGTPHDSVQQGTVWQVGPYVYNSYEEADYYVATWGSDDSAGTITAPWATLQHAFETADAGDTVYFRGGTYSETSTISYDAADNDGTYGNEICFYNYPNETPVFDFSGHAETGTFVGISVTDANYIKFRGLTLINVWQNVEEQWIAGWSLIDNYNIWLDQMIAANNSGAGFYFNGYDSLYLTNSDSYNNIDTTSTGLPGGRADGFILGSGGAATDTFKIAYISGNRSWFNSDDGFDLNTTKQVDMHDNWSWRNGRLQGDGVGFKSSFAHLKTKTNRKIYRNFAAYCTGIGFDDLNLNDTTWGPNHVYWNNTAYACYYGFGSGLGQFDCSDPLDFADVDYHNNIVHASTFSAGYCVANCNAGFAACAYVFPSYITQYNNSWLQNVGDMWTTVNDTFNITNDDFVSLDTTYLDTLRQSDGSLPVTTFLTLESNSDLIDGGVDVGLSYSGAAPDLGYAEYASDEGELTVELAEINHETNYNSEGSINITVSGGTSPYTYVWSNSETTQDISGLDMRSYTVTVTDDDSDTVIKTYSINNTSEGCTTNAILPNDN
jgi:hypothetical protein